MLGMLINENILDHCVKEAINEFMVNEGVGDVWNKFKGYAKDAFNSWMQWGTDGEYGKKFDARVSVNKFTELQYLKKWLDYHNKRLSYMLNNQMSPGDIEKDYTKWYENNDPQTYLKKYCAPWNFNKYARYYLKDRQAITLIDNYIKEYIYDYCDERITGKGGFNLKNVINNCDIYQFLGTDYGKQYIKMKNREQYYNKQQEEPQENQSNNAEQNQNNNLDYYDDYGGKIPILGQKKPQNGNNN